MRAVKGFVCWIYAIGAVFFISLAPAFFIPGRHSHYSQGYNPLLASFISGGIAVVLGLIHGMAWWTVYKGKPSARYWVILPSLIFLAFTFATAWRYPSHLFGEIMPFAMGIAGPLVTWRRSTMTMPAEEKPMPKIAGDGTCSLLNRGGQVFAAAAYLGAWFYCGNWVMHSGLPRPRSGLLVLVVAAFLATLVHELGHALVGLAVDMRLRAFIAGPFQWRMREGRWTFRFNLAGILTDEGATGVVPLSANQPRWQKIVMIAAGPVANLYSGMIALAFAYAFSTSGSAHREWAYPLALFGLYGLIGFLTNLIPLRTGTNYSDGAKIFQLLSNGPWADFHCAVSVVTSSLVSPMRPRDYDIQTLQRAAAGIGQGPPGMILRVWAYSHFLDTGRIPEAIQALEDAEQIVRTSAVDVPAGLHTAFIFGEAYVRRDAGAARQWWDAMQAKKPNHFNVDYYRAKSALHWIEGDLSQANIAWMKCDEAARKLPQAGAYEFDRVCCNLLRQAIDATPGGLLGIATSPATEHEELVQERMPQWSLLREVGARPEPSAVGTD
jgi:hypothetical protein